MKKFMLVLMAILMVVSMPVAAFAAHCDDCPDWSQEQLDFLYHPCYVGSDVELDMVGDGSKKIVNCFTTAWDEESAVTDFTDKFDVSFIIDGDASTGTYLPAAKQTRLRFAFGHTQEISQIIVVVNGKGTLNPGKADKADVFKTTDFDFTVQVVVKDELGGNTLYKSEPQSAKGKEELVFDVDKVAQGKTFDVIITDAATSTTNPRLWDVKVMEKDPAYAGAYDASEYEHKLVEVVDKVSTIVTPGQAHKECSRCDYKEAAYDLPLLADDALTGFDKVTSDDVTITEDLLIYDAEGKEIVDIDGNKKETAKFEGSDVKGLFDADSSTFWSVGSNGKATIEFKSPVTVYFFAVDAVLSANSEVKYEFYNGETAVAADKLVGATITKMVITMVNAVEGDKINEVSIVTHKHVFNADPTTGVNGGEEDPCKWTYTDKCAECEYVQELVAYVHDFETTVIKEATCGDGIASDKCKTCGLETGEYVVAGTGDCDFSTLVIQQTLANCGKEGKAIFACSKCASKQTASKEALVGKKLAADLVGIYGTVAKAGTVITEDILGLALETGALTFVLSATDLKSGAALTINYKLTADFAAEEFVVASVGAAPAGYHTVSWKTLVPSTYTTHGVEGAYCKKCGEEFKDTYRDAELVEIKESELIFQNIGFSKRVADFKGVRATFEVNRNSVKAFTDAGYSVRIWIIATNEAGESKEVQVFGPGAKAWMDYTGKTAVVIKGASANEVITFQAKISVKDILGEQIIYRDLGATSYNEIA